jgi:hypothetical protein
VTDALNEGEQGIEVARAFLETRDAPGEVGHGPEPMLKWFRFDHLPPKLRPVSARFCELALLVCKLPRSSEREVALRKLLESKDAAVRAAL